MNKEELKRLENIKSKVKLLNKDSESFIYFQEHSDIDLEDIEWLINKVEQK